MQRYAINVFWSNEDGVWVANVPDLKSCSAFGATPEEAVGEVHIAMDAWLAAARDAGLPIPLLRYRQNISQRNSVAAAPMPITIYGIKNCDTMKKARAWLDKHGVDYAFHDYKTAGIERAKLETWAKKAGWETLLNRAGTTFRKLPDKDKAA